MKEYKAPYIQVKKINLTHILAESDPTINFDPTEKTNKNEAKGSDIEYDLDFDTEE